ncbi:MAG: phosphotransferase [Anaerolineae bacterium]|nr:phosphotransferase [Anaerolineae bacterium]
MPARSLGEPIEGTGNLYAWGEGQILKLYGDEAPAGWVEHMGRVDRALHAAGLPVPAAGETIEIDSGLGLVYERIEGEPMANHLLGTAGADAGTVVGLARVFAEVHAQIHACGSIRGVPAQREMFPTIIRRIDALPSDLKEPTVNAFDKLPQGDRLCHGDFHPYNVLMSLRGPVVIDWNNAHIGNPLEDVARSALILEGVSVSQPSHRSSIERFTEAYLERYFHLRPGDQGQLAAWRPIVAAVRLADNIRELQEWLIAQVRAGLAPHD